MKHLLVLVMLVVAVAVLGIATLVSNHFGYASPFHLPGTFHFHGRDYLGPDGCTKPYAHDLPLRRVGSLRGFLTSSKPIYVGKSMPKGLDPVYLYVRAGRCYHSYDLSGGP